MFSTDKPITDASEDKLGRSGFAERLAKAIINFDTADSYATGLLNAYLVREHASEKVRESYTRISEGLQSHALTRDDYVWLENALLFLRPYWWSDREDGRMLMDALLHTQTLARRAQ